MSPGAADLDHHLVADVGALRARQALHLEAVADVDPGRAGVDALPAVDAIAGPTRRRGRLADLAARLAAKGVVADHDRITIVKDRLQPAVGAEDDAELLAKPGKVAVEGAGDRQ